MSQDTGYDADREAPSQVRKKPRKLYDKTRPRPYEHNQFNATLRAVFHDLMNHGKDAPLPDPPMEEDIQLCADNRRNYESRWNQIIQEFFVPHFTQLWGHRFPCLATPENITTWLWKHIAYLKRVYVAQNASAEACQAARRRASQASHRRRLFDCRIEICESYPELLTHLELLHHLGPAGMSTDESGYEDEQGIPIYFVWRHKWCNPILSAWLYVIDAIHRSLHTDGAGQISPARGCMVISPNAQYLAHYSRERGLVITAVNGDEQASYEIHNQLHVLSWNPRTNGVPEIFCGFDQGIVAVFTLISLNDPERFVFETRVGSVLYLDVCTEEDILAVAGEDGSIEVWDQHADGTWNFMKSLLSAVLTDNMSSHYTAVQFIGGSANLVVSTEECIICWNIKAGRKLWEIPVGLFFPCSRVQIIPSLEGGDGHFLVAFGENHDGREEALIYDIKARQLLGVRSLDKRSSFPPVSIVLPSVDHLNQVICYGGYEGRIEFMDLWSGDHMGLLYHGGTS
ncbi:hypothetical protein M422DRAFT_245959 [Sphaerobolus stellatus SS14]|nr:hypothetical protein M422DRAFT_245959 [Sphaerobolus stellatus SS14]